MDFVYMVMVNIVLITFSSGSAMGIEQFITRSIQKITPDLAQLYSGLFQTELQAKRDIYKIGEFRYETMVAAGISTESTLRPDDLDACCQTTFWHARNETVTTVEGDTKTVVHLPFLYPPEYQFLPHGTCTIRDAGICTGVCIQEHRIHFVLVHNPGGSPSASFAKVLVPAYCSCKHIMSP